MKFNFELKTQPTFFLFIPQLHHRFITIYSPIFHPYLDLLILVLEKKSLESSTLFQNRINNRILHYKFSSFYGQDDVSCDYVLVFVLSFQFSD